MSQQINLYQPIFRRQRKVFSAVTLAQIIAVISLGLAAIYGYGRWQLGRLEVDVAQLEAQQVSAQAQFDQLNAEVAARRDDRGLKAQLAEAESDLQARRQLLVWLGEHAQEHRLGFSAHLAGLARQHQGDLWLDGIDLGQGGQVVSLKGGSDEPAAVIRYLRRLGQEPAFAGLEFHSVQLTRPEDSTATALQFHVSNQDGSEPDAATATGKAAKP